MKNFRIIVALISSLTFAGRAAAQWAVQDLNSALVQIMGNQDQSADDAECCCDEEDAPAAKCCEDSCEASLCPLCADQILPSDKFENLRVPESFQPLILEVSSPITEGWRRSLKRPPRTA